MSTESLETQRAVVCGGSSGIGLAAARALLGWGAQVTIVGRTAERLEQARDELGDVTAVQLDCAQPQAVADFFAEQPPYHHVVVSLAASAALGPFADLSEQAFRETFEGKFWPYANVMRAAGDAAGRAGIVDAGDGGPRRSPLPRVLPASQRSTGRLKGW